MVGPNTSATADLGNPEKGAPEDDTAEWLDWDHWQGVEEYQDIVDGLGGPPLDEPAEGGEAAEEASRRQLHRHLRRRGIELEG
jgi:hypothetical protein